MIIKNIFTNHQRPISNKSSATALALIISLAYTLPANAESVTLPTIIVKDKVETKSESYQSGITKIGKSQQAAKDIPQSLIPIII